MRTTPYVVGQWVRGEKFYGRDALLDEILNGSRNSIWLLGTRRIGKTSVLKQLEHLTKASPEGPYFPIFWDFQGSSDLGELHGELKNAFLYAEKDLKALGIDAGDLEGSDLFDSLARLRRRLRGCDRKLLLLCDEVEELIKLHRQHPALLSKLRRALQSPEDVRAVISSTIRLWALTEERTDTSPFLHGFAPPLYIHGLGDDEARALVRQTGLPADSQPALDDGIVEEIRAHCDNHPYLIQLVCKRYLELRDLTEAIEQVAAEQAVSYFFSVDFEMLSPIEQDILRIIAEGGTAKSDSILDRVSVEPADLGGILRRLENLGYVRRDAERRFVLVNQFFRRWFRERQPGRPVAPMTPALAGIGYLNTQSTQTDGIALGTLFDKRYRLIERIGWGGSGDVYKARDEVVDEIIALKILKAEYCANPEVLERIRREILLSRDLPHPHVLRINHLGDCEGRKYLAMRFIDGPTLAKILTRDGALAVDRVVDIGRKLASALAALHARKIVHRDVKAQNVLLDSQGEPYLADFGLARLLDAPGMTESGIFLGTPDYTSPEQARRQPSDERSDLYSLGVVMFEMATGKRPFTADSRERVLQMHATATPPRPRTLRPDLPEDLSSIIFRCLEKDPARRYQTAQSLRGALERLQLG